MTPCFNSFYVRDIEIRLNQQNTDKMVPYKCGFKFLLFWEDEFKSYVKKYLVVLTRPDWFNGLILLLADRTFNFPVAFHMILSHFITFTVWYRLRIIQGHPDAGNPTVQLAKEIDFHETNIYYDHSNCVKSAIISLIGISSFSLSPNALYISSTSSLFSGKSPTFVKIALNSRLLCRFSKKLGPRVWV